jgi:branched-chain amino acid transport system permease protein/neutral amino acid transport system permease protein
VIPQLIANGIIVGGILALGAIGLTLTYGILRFANFAHGDMMTLGAYYAFLMVIFKVPLPAAFLISMLLTAVTAIFFEFILYRPLRRTGPIVLLISSIGVALFVRNSVLLGWGPDMKYYSRAIQIAKTLPLGVRIKPVEFMILGVTLAMIIMLHLFLTRTATGKAMRAVSDNMDLAQVVGINTDRIILWTWGIGAAMAAAAGIFLGLENGLRPWMGWELLLHIFAAAILGGLGKPYGAIAGGLIIGLSSEVSTAWISTAYKPAVAFTLMILVLLFRPQGIFGEKERVS